LQARRGLRSGPIKMGLAQRPTLGQMEEDMAVVTLMGRITELVGTRHWGKEARFLLQVSLEREPPGKVPVTERYYCCGFYVGEEAAAGFRPGQQVHITVEQD